MGTWVAPWVKCLTLDFHSGLDLTVVNSSPTWGFALGTEPTLKTKNLSHKKSPSKRMASV